MRFDEVQTSRDYQKLKRESGEEEEEGNKTVPYGKFGGQYFVSQ